jgi:hypothetical protein
LGRLNADLIRKSQGRFIINSNGNLLPRISNSAHFRIVENEDVPEVVNEETIVSVQENSSHNISNTNNDNENDDSLHDADYSYHYYGNNSLMLVEDDKEEKEDEEDFYLGDINIKVDDKIFARNAPKYGTFYPARVVKALQNDSYLISFLNATNKPKCIHKRSLIPVSHLRRGDKIKFQEDSSKKKYTPGIIIDVKDNDVVEARSNKDEYL